MKNSNKKLHKKNLITDPFEIQCNNESLPIDLLNPEILPEEDLLISPPGMDLSFDGDLDISPHFDEGFFEDELLVSPPGMDLPFDGDLDISPHFDEGFPGDELLISPPGMDLPFEEDLDISPHFDEGFPEDELLISPPGMEILPEKEIPPESPDLYTEEETIPDLFKHTKTEARHHLDYHNEAIQNLDLYRKTRKKSDLIKYYINMVKYYQCLYNETRNQRSLY